MTNIPCSLTTSLAAALLLCATWCATPTSGFQPPLPPEVARIQAAAERAMSHQADGRMGEHVAEMEEAVRQAVQFFGPDNTDTAQVLNVLGMVYEAKGRDDHALATFRRALKIAEAHALTTDNVMFSTLQNLAQIYVKKGKPAEAVPMFERALKVAEAKFGAENADTAPIQTNLARAYVAVGRSADAVAPAGRALRAIERRDGAETPSTIPFRSALGMAHEGLSQYKEAEKLYKQSLAIADAKLPAGHPASVQAINDLAHLYQATGRAAEAEPLARRVTQGRAAGPGVNPSDDATALNNQAISFRQSGRLAEAVPLFQQALALSEVRNGPAHSLTVGILGNLSDTLRMMARLSEAETYVRRALAARAAAAIPDDLPAALCRKILAEIYLTTGRHAEAETLFRQALAGVEKLEGAEHIDAGSILHGLACVLCLSHKYKDALDLDRRALAIVEAKLGPESRLAGSVLLVLGQSYFGLSQYAEAERVLRRSIAILEREARTDHPDTAAASNNLASVLMMTNRGAEAADLFRASAEAVEKRLGADHPDVARALSNLALVHARSGRWPEAFEAYDRSRHIRRRFLDRTLPGLAEDDQFALLAAGERQDLWGALSMGLARRDDPAAAERSASWVVNAKGVTLEALAQQTVLMRNASNPQAASIAAELTAIRRRLAEIGAPRPGRVVSSDVSYDQLLVQERELFRRLGLSLNRPVRDDPWVTLGSVRAALPVDAVLIEFARFWVAELSPESSVLTLKPERYAAWVIPPAGQGEVRLIDLGPATTIDQSVSEVARGITIDKKQYLDQGEPAEEKRLMPALDRLSRQVLGPLRTTIDPAKRWVISPDGSLWVVPWAALPIDPGVYAIERHLIHLVVSGRDLATAQARKEAPGGPAPPAIFADVDFDLASTLPVPTPPAADPNERNPGLSVSRGWFLPGPVPRLESSAGEAAKVAPLMKKYAGVAPNVYLRAAASETAFKQLRSPHALLLSTHGDFRDNPDTGPGQALFHAGSAAPTVATDGLPANPLLRCALLFAGVNKLVGSSAVPSSGMEDGVLTGLEIVGSDLRGTDLVVLSACKTGLGEIRASEGVAGLRQAFQIAGAPTVVSSLWNVDDVATADLVAGFFDNLSNGLGPASSLRKAQLRQIAERRNDFGAAHPYFWAAFSLTGRPGTAWTIEPVDSVVPASSTPSPASKPRAPLVSRGLETLSPAAVPLTNGTPAKTDVGASSPPRPGGLWPGADREGRNNPLAEGALLTLAIVATIAISRWWWLAGPSGQ